MKLIVLYRPDSEHARSVETFVHDYRHIHTADRVEMLNIDSRDGNATASLYDIMGQPAILVVRNDGSVLNSWVGPDLPLIKEVAAYSFS